MEKYMPNIGMGLHQVHLDGAHKGPHAIPRWGHPPPARERWGPQGTPCNTQMGVSAPPRAIYS